ncbi:MAG TPA: cache domain-containing protein, partial [Cytophagaceae bacterium]
MKFPVSHIKKLFKIKTLKNKFLISYTLVIIAAITTVGYVSYSKASHSINEELKRNTAQIIIQISNSIDTFVSDLNRMALVINSDEELLDILKKDKPIESLEDIRDYQKVQRSIQNASGFVPNIAGFNIFASDGRTFSMGNRSVKLNYDFTKTLWYKQLQNKDSIFIGTHFQEHVIDAYSQEVISLAKVIKDRDTLNIIGYVLIDCDTRTLESIFGSRKGYDKSSIFLVGTQNELIYSSKYQVCSFEQIKDLVKEFENLNDVGFSKHKVNGIEMLFSFYTSDLTGWKVVDAIPLYVVNENINDITNFSIIITFISLIVTIIISSLLAISITRPLTRLSEKMKVIEQGNFNVSVGFESDDEVGQLGRNFDRMVGKINEMIKKVYEAEFAKKEAEINALQAQINPHFLYNTLAAIDSIAT